MRNQFTFYSSFWAAVCSLKSAKDKLSLLEAICDYALNGQTRTMTNTAAACFALIKPILDKAEKRSKAGSISGYSIGETKSNEEQTEIKTKSNEEQTIKEKEIEIEIEKEIDIEQEKKEKRKREKFSPPTVEEVKAYCEERGNGIDPESFVSYYAQQGWKLSNGNLLRDWKAAVIQWEHRDKQKNGSYRSETSSTNEKFYDRTFADLYREMTDDDPF